MKALLAGLVIWLGLCVAAVAHETTRSYLTLTRDGTSLTADLRVAFRDIEVAVWIDEDLDGQITWAETLARIDAVSDYVTTALVFDQNGPCKARRTDAGASDHAGISHLDLIFAIDCPNVQAPLRVTSGLFAEFDPDHRLFLTAKSSAAITTTLLGGAKDTAVLSGDTAGVRSGFLSYFNEGLRHLLEGADHLVFLLVLLLPAAAARDSMGRALLGVLTAVTGFTLAHALTLGAAATSLLRPPTGLIETLIALSIVVAAIDNLRPFIPAPRAAVAAFFGLIHGFGFATALDALNLSGLNFATALIGFNLGIEAAQIGVVVAVLPALYVLGRQRVLLQIGNLGAIAVGLYWAAQRMGIAASL